MDNLQLHIESLIFSSVKAITIKEIKSTLDSYLEGAKIKEKEVKEALEALGSKYDDEKYPFEIKEIAGGFQFMTKGAFYPLVSQFLRIESKKKLSKAALETLAIISYKQPITKSVMESIRGVNCDYAVQKLLEKELIEIMGRAEGPGRPLLYGTSDKFMNHFGLKSLNELPKIKEFEMPENEVGPQQDDLPAPESQIEEAVAQVEAPIEAFDLTETEDIEVVEAESKTPESQLQASPEVADTESIKLDEPSTTDTVISDLSEEE